MSALLFFGTLWVIWAVLLFGGFVRGTPNPTYTRRIPLWNRLGSSITLVSASWVACLLVPEAERPFALGIALGMTFGCLGDFFMAEMLPVKNYVLFGMLAFGLGHVAYIGSVVYAFRAFATTGSSLGVVLLWWLIAAVLWYAVVYRGSQRSSLHYAALPYALLLASTAAAASVGVLQLGVSPFGLMTVGAVLFLLSDLILAARLFNQREFWLIDDVVWLTYGPGQMLIVYSLIIPLCSGQWILG